MLVSSLSRKERRLWVVYLRLSTRSENSTRWVKINVEGNKLHRQEMKSPHLQKMSPKEAGLPTAVVDWGKNATDSFSTAGDFLG